MPLPQDAVYTYADLLRIPENEGRYELYDGKVVALASPSTTHQAISLRLASQLHAFLEGKPCQAFAAPLDVRLFEQSGDAPEDVKYVVQPDLMVVCSKDQIDENGIHGAPALTIEILSDSTKQADKIFKFNLYQRAGVKEYWIVDPDRQTVQVFNLEDGAYHAPEVFTAKADIDVTVLPGCKIELAKVFDLPV